MRAWVRNFVTRPQRLPRRRVNNAKVAFGCRFSVGGGRRADAHAAVTTCVFGLLSLSQTEMAYLQQLRASGSMGCVRAGRCRASVCERRGRRETFVPLTCSPCAHAQSCAACKLQPPSPFNFLTTSLGDTNHVTETEKWFVMSVRGRIQCECDMG